VETVIPEQEQPKIVEIQDLQEEESSPVSEQGRSLEESPIFDTVASSDYFTFDKSSADPLLSEENSEEQEKAGNTVSEASSEEENTETGASARVSKYNDDKLPYTFLWWLHKTRREHAATYQPYASSFVPLK